jgi:hypothetical protein
MIIRATKTVPRSMSAKITPVIAATSFMPMLAAIFSFNARIIRSPPA